MDKNKFNRGKLPVVLKRDDVDGDKTAPLFDDEDGSANLNVE